MSAKPNVLFVITHDNGRHLGCYDRGVKTPNLDSIAAEGVLFEQAFCTAPQCSASRSSIMSGRHPHENGMIGLAHRGFTLNDGERLIPHHLGQAGYTSHLFGFQHEATDEEVKKRLGYATFERCKSRSCTDVVPEAIRFLEGKPKEPFFASIGFFEDHRPYPEIESVPPGVKPLPYLPDNEWTRRDVAELEVLVRRSDEWVGKILETLERTGLSKSTLLIYTTDHGIAFPKAKATMYDAGNETALLMRWPGRLPENKRIPAPVQNIDILPTLLEIAGEEVPDTVEGKSLLPLIDGKTKQLHDALYFEMTYHAAYDPVRAVRAQGFKYMRSCEEMPFLLTSNVDAGYAKEFVYDAGWMDKPRPKEQLFDLEADPNEEIDLAEHPDQQERMKRMRRMLDDWMERTNDPLRAGPVPAPEGATVTPKDWYGTRKKERAPYRLYNKEVVGQTAQMARKSRSGSGKKGRTWTREDAHER